MKRLVAKNNNVDDALIEHHLEDIEEGIKAARDAFSKKDISLAYAKLVELIDGAKDAVEFIENIEK